MTTPSLTLLSSALSLCRPTDRPSLASCLLFCSLALHYTALARRLSPELLGALRGLLYVAGKEHTVRPPPPCKGGALLLLTAPVSCPPSKLPLTEAVSVKDIDDIFKVAVIEAALKLLQKTLELYRDLASAKELFAPFLPVLAAIPRAHYPPHVVTAFGEVDTLLGRLCDKAGGVKRPDKQVPMLRMMEPALEEDFEPGKKKRTGSKELLEEQKMRHKLKQVHYSTSLNSFHPAIFRSGRGRGRRSVRITPSWPRREPRKRGARTRTGRSAQRRSSQASPTRREIITKCLKRKRRSFEYLINFRPLFSEAQRVCAFCPVYSSVYLFHRRMPSAV